MKDNNYRIHVALKLEVHVMNNYRTTCNFDSHL